MIRLALVVLAWSVLVPTSALAQVCAPGRVVTDTTAGNCCWPGQTWSSSAARCEGPPSCPAGYGGDGAGCVPLVGQLAAPSMEGVVHIEERVNYNVVGGGIALFLTTWGGGIAYALLANRCGGNVAYGLPFFFPFGSFSGLACGDATSAVTGLAFGVGQLLAVFLVAAGDTLFRYRVEVTGDGLAVAF
jgi:hypothetical protein